MHGHAAYKSRGSLIVQDLYHNSLNESRSELRKKVIDVAVCWWVRFCYV